ncbi:MAG: hypothetical protein M1333_02755, partial [Patescibacteria group bacterium]|nr:hypothetical protein [Patescibacteria group bacterium]
AEKTEFYVGSDIELIVTQAARLAVAKEKSFIDEQVLIEALGKFKPSITKEEIAYYDQFTNLERT